MAFIYDLTDTWDAGGTTFNAIKMNVTDTASAAGSKLVTLQVGGAERFTVDKAGNASVAGSLTLGSALSVANGGTGATTFTANRLLRGNGAGALQLAGIFDQSSAEAMRIDASGNVGIGTSSPSAKLDVYGGSLGTTAGNTLDIMDARGATSNNTRLVTRLVRASNGSAWTSSALRLQAVVDVTNQAYIDMIPAGGTSGLAFGAGAGGNSVERMRIDSSGNVLVGTTSTSAAVAGIRLRPTNDVVVTSSGAAAMYLRRLASDGDVVQFRRDASLVGSISVTTTATAYNTSSDYRLKDIDGPITNSGAYIDALKPVQGSWKADGSRFIGLLAHEAQEVSETTIATGEKDGEEMQAMDYSSPEIIANLIAEIQSLRARVAQLEGN